jgi:hypothetical protein
VGVAARDTCNVTLAAGNLVVTILGSPTTGTFAIESSSGNYCSDATTCGSVHGWVTIESTSGSIQAAYQLVIDATGRTVAGSFVAPTNCPRGLCG